MSPMPASARLNRLQQLQHLLVRPPVVVRTLSRRPSLRVTPRAAAPAFDVELGDGAIQPGSSLKLASSELLVQAPIQKPVFSTGRQKVRDQKKRELQAAANGPIIMVPKPLPSVLIIHTGGTLGMDPIASYEPDVDGKERLKAGGTFKGTLGPGDMLNNLLNVVPELNEFANLHLKVAYNKDSSRVGPKEWVELAKLLHNNRKHYDAFLVVHGTDTMAYTASALSLMLLGFRKPIVMTGSQLPLAKPRSDARQNLIDAITCATSYFNPPHSRCSCRRWQYALGASSCEATALRRSMPVTTRPLTPPPTTSWPFWVWRSTGRRATFCRLREGTGHALGWTLL
ncbi:TPA: hypothetical protein ACH3X1_004640 [Trebouxia sp. C0004]